MAKKDTKQKIQQLLEQEKKLKEQMKEAKKQMQKEEREERRRCYLEMGKLIESCLPRNFVEEDIEAFAKFVAENEKLISDCFASEEDFEDAREDVIDPSEDEDDEYEDEYEEEGSIDTSSESENLPFGG